MEGIQRRAGISKRHLGIAGLCTVAIQAMIALENEHSVRQVVEASMARPLATIHKEVADQGLIIERDFVRKSDLGRLDDKLDKVTSQIATVDSHVSKIDGYLKARDRRRWGSNFGLDFGRLTSR